MCFRKESLTSIRSKCENNTECKILVTTNNFGDPCFGVPNKQMMILYQCLDQTNLIQLKNCPQNTKFSICPNLTASFSQFQKQWCEPDTMNISCVNNLVINILCAYYGIDTNYKCNGGFYTGAPDACYGYDSYSLVHKNCQGKNNCSFNGYPSFSANSTFINWLIFYANFNLRISRNQ